MKDLKEHLKALELLFYEVEMQGNTSKTKVMIFTLKRKKVHGEFIFEDIPLQVVIEYKCTWALISTTQLGNVQCKKELG